MKNYDLFATYAIQFGLTFLPKGFDDATWEIATKLMTRALDGTGPAVTHALIDQHLNRHARAGMATRAPVTDRTISLSAACPSI